MDGLLQGEEQVWSIQNVLDSFQLALFGEFIQNWCIFVAFWLWSLGPFDIFDSPDDPQIRVPSPPPCLGHRLRHLRRSDRRHRVAELHRGRLEPLQSGPLVSFPTGFVEPMFLVVRMLLVAMPGAPSSVLAPSSKARSP